MTNLGIVLFSHPSSVPRIANADAGFWLRWRWQTALVQELYKPITAKHGYFISGKFDQFGRNVPIVRSSMPCGNGAATPGRTG